MKSFKWRIKIGPQLTTQNNLEKRKGNRRPDLKTVKILLQGWYQGTDFAKKNMSQMSAGAYKQNVTTATKLDIYQSSVRKNHLLKQA